MAEYRSPTRDELKQLVDEEVTALWALLERGRALAAAGDLPALRALATDFRRRLYDGNDRTYGQLGQHLDGLDPAMEELYERAFPLRDPDDPFDVLDAPWDTASRVSAAMRLAGPRGWPWPAPPSPGLMRHGPRPGAGDLIDRAVADRDVRLLALLLETPVLHCRSGDAARVLDGLYAAGALTVEHVELAVGRGWYLQRQDLFRYRKDGPSEPLACHDAVLELINEVFWRRSAPAEQGGRGSAAELPWGFEPRGPRFVRRAVGWDQGLKTTDRLGAAALTDAERDELVGWLRERPVLERERAFRLRLPVGDAGVVLPVLDLAAAEELFRLARAGAAERIPRYDRAAVLAAVERAGEDGARRLLELCPSEGISAALGWNADALRKRVKRDAHEAVAALGLLPLAAGETVLDRYLELRAVGKRGSRYGPERRLNHAAAVDIALDHLAQLTGFPDAGRLEWDCEARIAADAPGSWELDGYATGLRLDGAEPVLEVSRGGKALRSVPAAVRAHPRYGEVREQQKRLREQATRMRTGLIERLVATGGTLRPDELARLCTLPCGAAMLPALIWQDRSGAVGLLDEVDTAGPVTAAHPFLLYERGVLGEWQAEVVRHRLRQPVKQAFRELYVLTPAEREAVDRSGRFAGQVVNGRVAGSLLGARGWRIGAGEGEVAVTRTAGGGLTATVRCEVQNWFGGGDVTVRDVRFLRDGAAVPLEGVPAVPFSEAMRDLDLVVSVAGTDPDGYASPSRAESRAQLLATLIEELGLPRVRVDGTSAVVTGSRATYRVHLTSGSIHVEPGGYLCVVPATFGGTAHRRLFLPFADDDRMTSVILSKVLLLAEDEKITDASILGQLARLGAG
jgi:hypothetical protein